MATRRKDEDLHDALAELIEDQDSGANATEPEYQLLQNILELRERTVADCMCPRADILAISDTTSFDDTVKFITEQGHSRYPVYRENLDDVIGIIILKDVMAAMARGKKPEISTLLRDALFVPTSMPVMKLLMQMRQKRHYLAVVVDEYGGVDGLVTIEDLVEQIVGEIEDEHDETGYAEPVTRPDGSLLVDGRMPLTILEEKFESFLSEEDRDQFDTVNGLAMSLAGRVPTRGTQLTHISGVVFEIVEADARRVKRLRVKKAPAIKVEDKVAVSS